MTNTNHIDNLQIDRSPSKRAAEVLRLVFGHLSVNDREEQLRAILAGVRSGEVSRGGLLEARRGDRLVGTVFSQVQPGRTATVWLPRLLDGEPQATAETLLDASSEQLAGDRVRLAQVVLETVTGADDSVLQSGGFRRLTELLYLVCLEDEFPRREPSGPLTFEAYNPVDQDRLVRLVDATYQQTCDCPELNGIRRTEDVLAGYRATGVFDPARWLIVRHEGRDAGCLLLADHPEHANWELVYMGLAVSARGHGWGMHITRHAQWLTAQAGRSQLVAAVDAVNRPAISMYEAAGFRRWDSRHIYVKVFDS